jgi:protein-tyrosine-phosphatase
VSIRAVLPHIILENAHTDGELPSPLQLFGYIRIAIIICTQHRGHLWQGQCNGCEKSPRNSRNCHNIEYAQHNVQINHRACHIITNDFTKFDYILAADESNLRHVQGMERRLREEDPSNSIAEVKLWGSYLPGNKPIADPYYIDTEVSASSCVGSIFTAVFYRMALRFVTNIVSSFRMRFWTKLLANMQHSQYLGVGFFSYHQILWSTKYIHDAWPTPSTVAYRA